MHLQIFIIVILPLRFVYVIINASIKRGVDMIQISYKKLWILLIEHDMKRTDLIRKIGISASTLAKLGKNEPVHMEAVSYTHLFKWLYILFYCLRYTFI